MLYASDANDARIRPTKSARARCSLCHADLIAKCGKINIHHWSHKAGDCDSWSDGETDWHRGWKARADPSWCEVVLPPHRADIRRPDGLVIELQHSSIAVDEIQKREAFYGSMWWLFDKPLGVKGMRIFVRDDGTAEMRRLGARETLTRVKKPMFWDTGGPIFEFDGPLKTPNRGYGRLLSRSAFLAKAGLKPMNAGEAGNLSHYVVRRRDGLNAVALTNEHLGWWLRDAAREQRSVLRYRMDGSAGRYRGIVLNGPRARRADPGNTQLTGQVPKKAVALVQIKPDYACPASP